MTEATKRTLAFVVPFAVLYLGFAFVLMDLNPTAWGQENRAGYVMLSMFVALAASTFPGWSDDW